MSIQDVKFTATEEERDAARRIATRYNTILKQVGHKPMDALSVQMDLIAAHANGCPLDFARLEGFNDFNLLHDVDGIGVHLDRDTGQLRDHFSPRSARKD